MNRVRSTEVRRYGVRRYGGTEYGVLGYVCTYLASTKVRSIHEEDRGLSMLHHFCLPMLFLRPSVKVLLMRSLRMYEHVLPYGVWKYLVPSKQQLRRVF